MVSQQWYRLWTLRDAEDREQMFEKFLVIDARYRNVFSEN